MHPTVIAVEGQWLTSRYLLGDGPAARGEMSVARVTRRDGVRAHGEAARGEARGTCPAQGPVPWVVAPSLKVPVPAGVPLPACGATEAVKVTGWPKSHPLPFQATSLWKPPANCAVVPPALVMSGSEAG